MGAHSTLRITHTAARTYLLNRLLRSPDEIIEEMMDRALDERLYNVRLVGDGEENDDGLLL